MSRIDANMSGYLHAYEAYRIPKGTKVKDAAGKDVVLSNEEDVLVLTEKAGKQLVPTLTFQYKIVWSYEM